MEAVPLIWVSYGMQTAPALPWTLVLVMGCWCWPCTLPQRASAAGEGAGSQHIPLPPSWALARVLVPKDEALKAAPGSSVTSRNVCSFL